MLSEDGFWSLEILQHQTQTMIHYHADALIIATGSNQVPKEVPTGLSEFGGRILHSVDYNEGFRKEVVEKKLHVLVVGGGESGADISADLGELSPHTTVWLRRPVCVGPRYLNNKSEIEQVVANKKQNFPANGFLEAATTNRMSAAQNVFIYGLFRRVLWHTPVLNRTLARVCLDSTASAFLMNDQATYVTKNQRMCEAWEKGKIDVLISPSVRTYARTCEFRMPDGTVQKRDFDVIVNCTGFRTHFPWLKVKDFNPSPRSWYLHCFPERLGHHLFFVGYARPHQGAVAAMAEMLSRYISLLLRGERHLPNDYAVQARYDQEAEREYYFISPDLDSLVDYNAFLESVARRVGCEPRLPIICILAFNFHMLATLMLFIKPFGADQPYLSFWALTIVPFFTIRNGLLIKWWFYPHWNVWYRQRGPDANPLLLERIMQRVNLWEATAITTGFVLLILWSWPMYYAQRLISIIAFVPDIVLATMGVRFPKTWGALLRPKLFALHSSKWRISDLFLP